MTKTELPENLQGLYKHWRFHTTLEDEGLDSKDVWKDESLHDEINWFIQERISIWKKKTSGEKAPFTEDPILATYRFCNIFREFDRQTIEFHTLLKPLEGNLPLWLLNMFYCRLVAKPDTVQKAGLLSFDPKQNQIVYDNLINCPRPMYGTPYVFPISTIQRGPTPTRELFITKYLPVVMEEVAREIVTWRRMPVYEGVRRILPVFKYELHFHWTEVLIDLAYQFPQYVDLFAQFPIGPGSMPTLSTIDPAKDPSLLVVDLSKTYSDTGLTFKKQPIMLSAENWEGIGCEFRKYSNLKKGAGRRRLYKSSKEASL